ncbi:MAG: SigE family RNA polymerase sigma factor [Nostocoides sp.]
MTATAPSAGQSWPLPTTTPEGASAVPSPDFDRFYRESAHRVIHLVYASTGDLTLAQDCTQEAYARAWQRWSQVSQAEDPLAWVRTVARRLAISQWRKETNRGVSHRQLALVRTQTAAVNEDRAYVVAALRALSPQHREVLALHYLLDMSIAAIADELGAPIGTLKARLHHGRKALAETLRAKEGTHG